MHCLLWQETGIEVRAQSAEYKTEFMIHYTSVCVSVRDTGQEIMKPRPVLLVYYAAVRLLLISITSPDSFSHHTPVSLTTNYFVRVEMNRRTVFAGLQSDEGDDRKGCFLSRQRRTGCWCGTRARGTSPPPRTPPIISHRVQSSPAMASISCFLSRRHGQVRERGSNMQPQLEDGGWSGASRWVAASTFSGQEALLKNKAALCFWSYRSLLSEGVKFWEE